MHPKQSPLCFSPAGQPTKRPSASYLELSGPPVKLRIGWDRIRAQLSLSVCRPQSFASNLAVSELVLVFALPISGKREVSCFWPAFD